jgi:hypothetical protein
LYTCKNFKESLGVKEGREEADKKIAILVSGAH